MDLKSRAGFRYCHGIPAAVRCYFLVSALVVLQGLQDLDNDYFLVILNPHHSRPKKTAIQGMSRLFSRPFSKKQRLIRVRPHHERSRTTVLWLENLSAEDETRPFWDHAQDAYANSTKGPKSLLLQWRRRALSKRYVKHLQDSRIRQKEVESGSIGRRT